MTISYGLINLYTLGLYSARYFTIPNLIPQIHDKLQNNSYFIHDLHFIGLI